MEFWNSLLTEKSWKILQDIKKEKFRFIVIGGWAAYLWTKQHKSKDIDVIIPDFNELEILKDKFDLRKNDSLKKYEIKIEDIDIDIYIPYFSKFVLEFKDIIDNSAKVEGFEVVKPEILLILKQAAELDRKDSVKGQKDRIDIVTLLCYSEVDFKKYNLLLKKYKILDYRKRLVEIIKNFDELKHLNLDSKNYSKIKKELLKKI